MKNLKKVTYLFFLMLFLISCKTTINNKTTEKELENLPTGEIKEEKRKMEIRFSCGEGDITEFLNDGWVILEEYSEEKVCTWKSIAANENCDLDKDKGCKITTPDKIGEEKIYLLEKI